MVVQMERFVRASGIYTIIIGLGFTSPRFLRLFGLSRPDAGLWWGLLAALMVYIGIVLILCSRDLEERASLICWNAVLRIIAFLLLAGFGFWGGFGAMMGVLGIIELAIAVVYLVGVPKALGVPLTDLLLDRLT